jgi:MFS family permease
MTLQIHEGLSYLSAQPPLKTLLLWVGLHCSLTMASVGILPAVATADLHGNAQAYGLLLTAFGLGSVIGPLGIMAFGRRYGALTVLIVSGVLSGLPLVTLGLIHQIGIDTLSAAVAGAAQAVFMAGIYSANQGVSTDAMRGRVASVQLSLTTGAMGLASVGWGALVGLLTPGVILAVPGAVFVVACVPFALRRRRIARELHHQTSQHTSSISGHTAVHVPTLDKGALNRGPSTPDGV